VTLAKYSPGGINGLLG